MPTVKYKSGNNWVNVSTSGSIATDSTYGYVKIATDADVAAGTDNTAAITAKQLKEQLGASGGLVHIEGAETINGLKTINNNLQLSGIEVVSGQESLRDFHGIDTNIKRVGGLRFIHTTADKRGAYIFACNANNENKGAIAIYVNSDGQTVITSAPVPTDTTSTSSNQIATVGWVNTIGNNVVHLTGNETIGGTKTFSDTIQGTAYRALWGDLAEYYLTDKEYSKGTLVQFGGEKEITIATKKVNAVITSEPGFILNSSEENSQAIALIGRVPVRVIGKVKKFDKIALSYIDGVGCVSNESDNVIGIALENKDDSDEGLVICSVKIDLA